MNFMLNIEVFFIITWSRRKHLNNTLLFLHGNVFHFSKVFSPSLMLRKECFSSALVTLLPQATVINSQLWYSVSNTRKYSADRGLSNFMNCGTVSLSFMFSKAKYINFLSSSSSSVASLYFQSLKRPGIFFNQR